MEGDLILISRLTIEAETPICISAGSDDTISHAIFVRDVNQLPYIPASTIKGVIFKEFGIKNGMLNNKKIPYLSFTDALMTDEKCKVIDGRKDYNIYYTRKNQKIRNDTYLGKFERLPIRYHVTTDYKGSSSFDIKGANNEQVVYKGTRFVFEMEMRYDKNTLEGEALFDNIIRLLKFSPVRFGRGSRRGLGKIKLVKCLKAKVNMKDKEQREAYLKKSGELNEPFGLYAEYTPEYEPNSKKINNWQTYKLTLKPRDFFIFGAPYDDEKINYPSAMEKYIEWTSFPEYEPAKFKDGFLIPASAIKGTLLHRTKYHYCKIKDIYSNNSQVNDAICQLFGGKHSIDINYSKGNVIFSDVIIPWQKAEGIVFNNVGIDRLSGKQYERVFYSQRALRLKGDSNNNSIEINIFVKEKGIEEDVMNAFLKSIKDLCEGRLPLGRGNNLGMGFFEGDFKIYK